MEQAGRNARLNLLKGFACIGVVFIHVTFPGVFGQIIKDAAGFAVPVFFITAGYYACGKNTDVIKRRLIKIIQIFLYAYALYLIYYVVAALINHDLTNWAAKQFNWMTPIKYVVFCTVDFAIPLWYLIAMIEVYVAWLFIIKIGKEQQVIKWMPLLFVLQVVLTTYCETMSVDWYLKINFITRGMPWFLLGYYLHMDESQKLRNIKQFKLIAMAVFGCAISIVPSVFHLPIKCSVIGYIPYAFALFTLTLKDHSSRSSCKLIEFIGDKLSLDIYIYHKLVGIILSIFCVKIMKLDLTGIVFLWLRPVIVLILTTLLSWILYVFNKRRNET